MNTKKAASTRKIALSAVLAAIAVVLSPVLSIPLLFATPFPVQSAVNVIAGILLGPWYAVLIAIVAALIRNILHTGTIFAFPGGIFGALLVGLVYRYIIKQDYAAFFEIIGTGIIGAVASAYLVGPWALQAGLIGSLGTLSAFVIAFLAASITGSIIGFIVVTIVHKTGFWHDSP